MTAARPLLGGIEAGGTKFVLGIGTGPDDLRATTTLPTTLPDETLQAVLDWFAAHAPIHGPLAAIGITSFGPLDLDVASATYGQITATPKPGWSNTDMVSPIAKGCGVPVGLDTDVNGAALAEYLWGAAQNASIAVYFTAGTGIGGGAVINGQTLRSASHPEMGHIAVRRHPSDHSFAGICPFHGDCLEGMASGPAIKARWGNALSELGLDHPGHAIIASYLAQAVVAAQAMLAPARIILGGGVLATPGLLARVQAAADALGNGYFATSARDSVAAPGLGSQSGLMGAFALALQQLDRHITAQLGS